MIQQPSDASVMRWEATLRVMHDVLNDVLLQVLDDADVSERRALVEQISACETHLWHAWAMVDSIAREHRAVAS